ncbi:MAG TPA: hypothetical protein DCY13_21250, partial [Verrucomicrobiales bacterium]|nr:hypothetical protein [Verrucomicrobiales bacterium]
MNPTNHLSTPKRPVRRLPAFVGALHFAATSLLLVAITAGSAAPALSLSAERTVAGQITLAWSPASGRNYELLAAGNLGEPWAPLASPAIPAIATGPAIRVELAAAATTQFLRLRENKSPYDPAWETVVPLRTIRVNHDGAKTAEQNGASLKAAMLALVAGDRLEVGAGTYSINSFTTINLQGTAAAPIWIVAAEGARVVITRPDADQNLLNVGFGGPARHLCFRDLEFVGGSHGLRLYDCANVWIDRCKIRDTADVG